ncbi:MULTISPECIES: hypothetical protein [Halanaerobium]|uniref:Outer membrane protein beta-barrel domain-containing protein n=1 Tax=Halanaerobium kushneri TaxID=56779 RepID=A0A1N7BPF3_9FIRM|nr:MULTISPECIES: hypothetical protein [Halanaerobium]RCW52327.1 hypothetical protein DFR80_13019 [Halanaerobium sp. ST460_2HS_T2]SIR53261.1 hypothetical protein SAMN05421834_13322 [Halanaerobium kushneri]
MSTKNFFRLPLAILLLVILISFSAAAQNNDNQDLQENEIGQELEDRIELIQASQNLSAQKNDKSATGVSLYLTTFHAGEKELNLGGKFEGDFFKSDSYQNFRLAYVLEGIYLEDEDINLAGFLSIKATLNDKLFSPYFGVGAEFMGKADYQGFVGLNLNNNFFVETKFINDKDELDQGDFYSSVGFKLNF